MDPPGGKRMKSVHISQYLNHIGQEPSPDRQAPTRLRPVLAATASETRSVAPMFRTLSEVAMSARNPADRQRFEPVKWPITRSEAGAAPTRESAPTPDVETRIDESYERGLRDGAAGARAELAQTRALEVAADRERTEVERIDFHLNEYAKLANVIGAGLIEIEECISACVARILAPFIEGRTTRQVIDELSESIRSLRASASPALITIRGPEHLLHLLRERVASLGAEVEYVVRDGIEVSVKARDTLIESQLKAWADLLATIDR
jgi:hypothetical protein